MKAIVSKKLTKLTPVMFSFKSCKKILFTLARFQKGYCVFDSSNFADGLFKFPIFLCHCIVWSFFLYALECYMLSSLQIDVGGVIVLHWVFISISSCLDAL